MNKDNAKEYLPLVQALAEGKTIQYQPLGENLCTSRYPKGIWSDIIGEVNFIYEAKFYRIKPQPIELEFWYKDTAGAYCPTHSEDEESYWTSRGYRKIKVKEVL